MNSVELEKNDLFYLKAKYIKNVRSPISNDFLSVFDIRYQFRHIYSISTTNTNLNGLSYIFILEQTIKGISALSVRFQN